MSVQFLHDEFNISRPAGVTITGSILAVLGTLCALSFGTLSHVTIFGKSFFDFFDYLTSNIGMPIGVIGIAIVTAWLAHDREPALARQARLRLLPQELPRDGRHLRTDPHPRRDAQGPRRLLSPFDLIPINSPPSGHPMRTAGKKHKIGVQPNV